MKELIILGSTGSIGTQSLTVAKEMGVRVTALTAHKNVELLDTPGVLWPKFEDETVGMNLAITGAINDQILPLEEVAYHALKYMKEGYRDRLESIYEVEVLDNSFKLFQSIGKKRGYLLKGNEVDMKRVIDSFMKDIRQDKFGPITWEKSDEMREQE